MSKFSWGWWIVLFAVLFIVFLPETWWLGSRLIYGNPVRFENVVVTIPIYWAAHPVDHTLVLSRLPRAFPLRDAYSIVILKSTLPIDAKEEAEVVYRKWAEWESGDLLRAGFPESGYLTLETVGGEIHCVEGISNNGSSAEVRCLNLANLLYIVYDGPEYGFASLYKVIKELSYK